MRRLVALPLALVTLAVIAGGCRHDGREMRPALPSQDGSVSTTAASTVPPTEDDSFNVPSTLFVSTSTTSTSLGSTTLAASTTTTDALAPVLTAPWRDAAPIDPRYTCKGDNIAPALSWSAAPEGTQEIAVTMIDHDAAFDHWAMTGIRPDVLGLAENEVPAGAAVALNGNGTAAYTGPCPPAGTTHTYVIAVHYLAKALQLTSGSAAADMRAAIDAATITTAHVSGTFVGS